MRAILCLAAGAIASCSPLASSGLGGERPTIVSLNPCTDAILAEMAGPEQVLAISHYSHDPRASSMQPNDAARYRSTGGTVEEVLALDPDVVVTSIFVAPATRVALEDLGIRVEAFGIASSVADSVAQVRELAALAGRSAAGEKLVSQIESAVASPPRRQVDAVLWQPGGIVPGEGALVVELLGAAGFANGAARRGLGQADYLSLEQVVADPPEMLFVAGSERGQRHPVLAQMPEMRIETLDPALLYCGGPTIPRAMERLRAL